MQNLRQKYMHLCVVPRQKPTRSIRLGAIVRVTHEWRGVSHEMPNCLQLIGGHCATSLHDKYASELR